jgi:arabinofuranosyltransferase
MGYYASATPNTAIAKEAFLVNWSQGHCYLDTFVATYHLAWPLMAAGVFWIARLYHHVAAKQWLALGVALGVPAAAATHVAYLVAIGGDYMHGRLLVPAAFAALLPIMTVPAEAPRVPLGRSVLAAAGLTIVAWSIVCWVHFRVGVENVCGVGDERGWYSRTAGVDNPVTIENYGGHFFASSARQWLDRIRATCPDVSSPWHGVVEPGCRNVYIADDKAPIVPAPQVAPAVRDLDPRVAAVVPVGAIGVVGYMLPERVHVIDVNGLSDPVVGRFEIHTRGRPGHEKTLPAAWTLARYSEPAPDEDASVTAARHALSCGALSALERGITQPLTVRSFLNNVAHAWNFSRVRIPRDPFEAEERFCGLAPRPELTAGGGGGAPFRWLCAKGRTVTGLRGAFKDSDHAISLLQAVCTSNRVETPDDDPGLVGPAFGEASDDVFEVTCPPETSVAGMYGSNGDFVRSVGLVCSRPGKSLRTSAGGVSRDRAFALVCPGGTAVVGVTGRSGALVDAAGVVCGPAERR